MEKRMLKPTSRVLITNIEEFSIIGGRRLDEEGQTVWSVTISRNDGEPSSPGHRKYLVVDGCFYSIRGQEIMNMATPGPIVSILDNIIEPDRNKFKAIWTAIEEWELQLAM